MREISAVTPIYAGVSYDRLNAGEQLQWPVKDATHSGTPILHVGKFSRGLGRFVPAEHMPPAELPDEEYPLMLTTGRCDLSLARRGDDAARRVASTPSTPRRSSRSTRGRPARRHRRR